MLEESLKPEATEGRIKPVDFSAGVEVRYVLRVHGRTIRLNLLWAEV